MGRQIFYSDNGNEQRESKMDKDKKKGVGLQTTTPNKLHTPHVKMLGIFLQEKGLKKGKSHV